VWPGCVGDSDVAWFFQATRLEPRDEACNGLSQKDQGARQEPLRLLVEEKLLPSGAQDRRFHRRPNRLGLDFPDLPSSPSRSTTR